MSSSRLQTAYFPCKFPNWVKVPLTDRLTNFLLVSDECFVLVQFEERFPETSKPRFLQWPQNLRAVFSLPWRASHRPILQPEVLQGGRGGKWRIMWCLTCGPNRICADLFNYWRLDYTILYYANYTHFWGIVAGSCLNVPDAFRTEP